VSLERGLPFVHDEDTAESEKDERGEREPHVRKIGTRWLGVDGRSAREGVGGTQHRSDDEDPRPRRRMATLTEQQREFLTNPFVGTVTTLRADGSPHSTIVWVDDEENGEISFNTAFGRLKPHNLERDPRVALLVLDPNDAYRWVALDGLAELTTDGADAQIDRLAKKYLGKDEYPFRKPDEQRVTVRITPRRIDSSGF
jgi:PPOX class probable F420-dependent enzyme